MTLKRRRKACANSRWNVYFDHVSDDTGFEVRDYLVVEPKHSSPAGHVTGITVLPVLHGKIGLLRVYRHALRDQFWEGARGFLDAGEEPAEAAVRELEEETGLICAPQDLVFLGYLCQEPSTLAARVALFAATQVREGGNRHEHEMGVGRLRLFSRASVRRMMREGEIEDACTLGVLSKYLTLPRRQS